MRTKLLTLVAFCSFLITTAFAQSPTYLRSYFGVVGDTIPYIVDTLGKGKPWPAGAGGANGTWAFNTQFPFGTNPYTTDIVFKGPAGEPAAGSFPSCDLVIKGGGITGFYKNGNDTIFLLGGYGTFGTLSKALVFQPRTPALVFPMTNGQTFSHSYKSPIRLDKNEIAAATGQSVGTISLVLDSIEVITTSNITSVVDGYGSVVIKGDTLNNALRIKRTSYNKNDIRSKSRSLPFGPYTWQAGINVTGFTVAGTTRDTAIQYSWLPVNAKYTAFDYSVNPRDTTRNLRHITPCGNQNFSVSGPTTLVKNVNGTYTITDTRPKVAYTWTVTGGTIVTGQGTKTLTAKSATAGSMVVSASAVKTDGCSKQLSKTTTVTNTTATEQELTAAGWSLYPNPSNGPMELTGDLNQAGSLTFRMVDLSGRTVWTETSSKPAGTFQHTLDIGSLPQGLYLLSIEGESFRYFSKVARQ
jgi:hypothetical protein